MFEPKFKECFKKNIFNLNSILMIYLEFFKILKKKAQIL